MKIAFLTEMNFEGMIPENHRNMRTEFAWMHALNAYHYNIYSYPKINGFDFVFIIFPKGTTNLSADASEIRSSENKDSKIFSSDITSRLKSNNQNVCFIQEGPAWFFNDYSVLDQINYYNHIQNCDIIFSHNETDTMWYKGLFPDKRVEVLPTLMIETLIKDIIPTKENKVIVGGNFSKWYGGFQSYMVSSEFKDCSVWTIESHSKRPNEDKIQDLNHLPRLIWDDWVKELSKFKYAVHLMPTVAAGTFSLNCAYLGIPCIGNIKVDTQRICFPELSVDVEDVYSARLLAKRLFEDNEFYQEISKNSKIKYRQYFSKEIFLNKMNKIL